MFRPVSDTSAQMGSILLCLEKFNIILGCKDPETKSGRITLSGVVSGEQ